YLSDISIKRKWKNLKDYYRKELKKVEKPKSGDGASEIVNSTWPYFNQSSFLKDIYLPEYRSSNLSQEENIRIMEDDLSLVDDDIESNVSHVSPSFVIHNSRAASPALPPDTGSTSQDNGWQTNPSTKKRRRASLDYMAKKSEELVKIEKQKLEMLRKEQEESGDEELYFFKSLLPYKKKLNHTKKLRMRMQIQNLFLKEMEEVEQNERPSRETIGAMHSTPNPYIDLQDHDYCT
ncbi:uncharacterized protein, partial [Palaemon carinicauda]|uniref:uncharacterized protein n=1 Tax=Palaemon carinicauda TaxID=392227 RepID=UPI0035B570DE